MRIQRGRLLKETACTTPTAVSTWKKNLCCDEFFSSPWRFFLQISSTEYPFYVLKHFRCIEADRIAQILVGKRLTRSTNSIKFHIIFVTLFFRRRLSILLFRQYMSILYGKFVKIWRTCRSSWLHLFLGNEVFFIRILGFFSAAPRASQCCVCGRWKFVTSTNQSRTYER